MPAHAVLEKKIIESYKAIFRKHVYKKMKVARAIAKEIPFLENTPGGDLTPAMQRVIVAFQRFSAEPDYIPDMYDQDGSRYTDNPIYEVQFVIDMRPSVVPPGVAIVIFFESTRGSIGGLMVRVPIKFSGERYVPVAFDAAATTTEANEEGTDHLRARFAKKAVLSILAKEYSLRNERLV